MTVAISPRIPKYRQHKPTGQAVVTLHGKDHYLGKHGTAASKEKYARLIHEWLERGQQPTPRPTTQGTTADFAVNELIPAYCREAQEYYREAPKEREKITLSVRPLRHLYGRTNVAAFGPLALKAVRSQMAKTLARSTVNMRVNVIKRMFGWGTENELVPAGVYEKLRAVKGLRKGRSAAREPKKVRPVTDAQVTATLTQVNRHVRGMIEFQRLTGSRSGEVCILRACDIDMTAPVWVYRPATHKNEHREHVRLILIGPRAQGILQPFLTGDPTAYLFNPRLAMQDRYAALRQLRRSKVPPSQLNRRKRCPKRKPGKRYDVRSYYHAVRKACQRAGMTPWHPHQLRHTAATLLRKEFGVETARIVLGHATAFTTEIYAEADLEKAREVMGKIG
jgi:integrase